MPIDGKREYRAIVTPFDTGATQKRLESDFYVEGYATTFDSPYLLWEWDGVKYYEVIDRNALVGADLSDVIMQYNHHGKVFARNKMAKGKAQTLIIEPNDKGLFIAADLGLTEESRKLHDEIDKGLIYQMSWAFTVTEDSYNKDTHTRTITKIKKVYDVSAVSIPANADTDISARSWLDGVIEAEKREAQEQQAQLELRKRKLLLL